MIILMYKDTMGNCCIHTFESEVAVPTLQNEAIYQNSTDENTPFVSYENIRKKVKILRVLDGDTVDIAMHQEETNKIFKYRIRLYGIDTPEKKPLKSNPDREKEIAAAKQSTKAMIDKMQENNNIVTIVLSKPDKYGRLLGTFYDKKGENINQWMVTNGYATEYFGKTKKSFNEVCNEREIELENCNE